MREPFGGCTLPSGRQPTDSGIGERVGRLGDHTIADRLREALRAGRVPAAEEKGFRRAL